MAQYLKKKTFAKVMRGYSPEEVDSYIKYLVTNFNNVSAENEENKKALIAAKLQIRELKEGGTMQSQAVPSVESREESLRIIEEAKAEARRIIEIAEKNAQDIVRAAQTTARETAVSITAEARQAATAAEFHAKTQLESAEKFYREVFSFRDKLFEMYRDHIELLESVTEEANAYYDAITEEGVAVAEESAEEVDEAVAEESAEEVDEAVAEESAEEADEAVAEEFAKEADEAVAEEIAEEADEAVAEEIAEEADDIVNDILKLTESLYDDEEESEFSYGDITYPVTDDDEFAAVFESDLPAEGDDSDGTELRIDWNKRRVEAKSSDMDDFQLLDEEDEEVFFDEDGGDFSDLDALFQNHSKGSNSDMTDEFDIVYSSRNSAKNVEEIGKQPLVAPARPTNPKKHKRF